MILLCDVDGVLADFAGAIVREVNAQSVCSPKKVSDITEWDIAKALGVPFRSVAAIAEQEGFCESLAVLPGAEDLVETLRSFGDVYFCTSPFWSSRTWVYERTEWLKKHFAASNKEIIATSAKHLIHADVLVDDKPDTIDAWIKARRNDKLHPTHLTPLGLLWDAPYNRGHRSSEATSRRVFCHDDVKAAIQAETDKWVALREPHHTIQIGDGCHLADLREPHHTIQIGDGCHLVEGIQSWDIVMAAAPDEQGQLASLRLTKSGEIWVNGRLLGNHDTLVQSAKILRKVFSQMLRTDLDDTSRTRLETQRAADWHGADEQRDVNGAFTPLAMALQALADHGCDCGTDEPGTCLACVCEEALKDLWIHGA